jgi:N-acyl-phosphatidylethanolamine-hydrolysing phospholipase D
VFTGLLRWAVTRALKPRIDRTERGRFPSAVPSFASPRAEPATTTITWVGHATFLIQIGGLNVLTDPVWSARASPVSFAGPRRYLPPGIPFEDLPPIDLVLVSHDHYDHLDDPTVRRLAVQHADASWLAPLGLSAWLTDRGVAQVRELDWWDRTEFGRIALTALPAQHFSGRTMRRNRSLWCGWALRAAERAVCFVGDTGLHPAFREIAARCGPFDLVITPIGAYDSRWFMAPVHLDPEEAVRSFQDLAAGALDGCRMVPMHWGTFKLTDEPMTEPPERARVAWRWAGLRDGDLWILAHGETRRV